MPRVWAKREDCNSGLAYGGNKTRKLEYLVADALAQGCDTLVSIGGVQSNHTRQVAAVAARVGLSCVLVQESWVDWPDAVYDKVGNILISRLAGADVRLVKAGFGIGFKESWEQALAEITGRGGKPYPIPAGASDHPLGGLGFASWASRSPPRKPSWASSSTRSSCARSRARRRPAWWPGSRSSRNRRLVRAACSGSTRRRQPAETRDQVARIARRTAEAIGLDRELRPTTCELDERYHAGMYGIPDDATLRR